MTLRRIAIEAGTVLAGAVIAALIIRQLPGLRAWVADAWAGGPGCDCQK